MSWDEVFEHLKTLDKNMKFIVGSGPDHYLSNIFVMNISQFYNDYPYLLDSGNVTTSELQLTAEMKYYIPDTEASKRMLVVTNGAVKSAEGNLELAWNTSKKLQQITHNNFGSLLLYSSANILQTMAERECILKDVSRVAGLLVNNNQIPYYIDNVGLVLPSGTVIFHYQSDKLLHIDEPFAFYNSQKFEWGNPFNAVIGVNELTGSIVYSVYGRYKVYKYMAPPSVAASPIAVDAPPVKVVVPRMLDTNLQYFYRELTPDSNGGTLNDVDFLSTKMVYVNFEDENYIYFIQGNRYRKSRIVATADEPLTLEEASELYERVIIVPSTFAEREMLVQNHIAPGDVYSAKRNIDESNYEVYTHFGVVTVPRRMVTPLCNVSSAASDRATMYDWYRFYGLQNSNETSTHFYCFVKSPPIFSEPAHVWVEATARHSGLGNTNQKSFLTTRQANLIKDDAMRVKKITLTADVLAKTPGEGTCEITAVKTYQTRLKNTEFVPLTTRSTNNTKKPPVLMELWSPMGILAIGPHVSEKSRLSYTEPTILQKGHPQETNLTHCRFTTYLASTKFVNPKQGDKDVFFEISRASSTAYEKQWDSKLRWYIADAWNKVLKDKEWTVDTNRVETYDPPTVKCIFDPADSSDAKRVLAVELLTQYLVFSGARLPLSTITEQRNFSRVLYDAYLNEVSVKKALQHTLGYTATWHLTSNDPSDGPKLARSLQEDGSRLVNAVQYLHTDTVNELEAYEIAKEAFISVAKKLPASSHSVFKLCVRYAYAKRAYMRACAYANRFLDVDYEADYIMSCNALQYPIYNLVCQYHLPQNEPCGQPDMPCVLIDNMHRVLPPIALPLVNQIGAEDFQQCPSGITGAADMFMDVCLGKKIPDEDKRHMLYRQVHDIKMLMFCFRDDTEKDNVPFVEGLGPMSPTYATQICSQYETLFGKKFEWAYFYKTFHLYRCPVLKGNNLNDDYLEHGALTITPFSGSRVLCRMIPRRDRVFTNQLHKLQNKEQAEAAVLYILYLHVVSGDLALVQAAECSVQLGRHSVRGKAHKTNKQWRFGVGAPHSSGFQYRHVYHRSKNDYIEVNDGSQIVAVKLLANLNDNLTKNEQIPIADIDRQTLIVYVQTTNKPASIHRFSDGRLAPEGLFRAEKGDRGVTYTEYDDNVFGSPEVTSIMFAASEFTGAVARLLQE